MADFCGLTRVKTWRWSRLFACAVAVLCALSPIKSFATSGAYTCETSVYAVCNPGFSINGLMYPGNKCNICPSGNYKALVDTKDSSGGGTNYACSSCPANGTCPEITKSGISYGRPLVVCNAGFYRDNASGGFACEACPTGYTKDADSTDNTDVYNLLDLDSSGNIKLDSDGRIQLKSGATGQEYTQCKACDDGYYQKGYYTGDTSSYYDSNRCAKCPEEVGERDMVISCSAEGQFWCNSGLYREPNDDGTVSCNQCPGDTTKDADDDDFPIGSSDIPSDWNWTWACNYCKSGAYYYSRQIGDVSCYPCPANSVKHPENGVSVCNTEARNQTGVNDIGCVAGYYRKTIEDGTDAGKVECRACDPTNNVSDNDRTYTTKAADANAGLGSELEDGDQSSCNECISGEYYYSRKDGEYKCYKCPVNSYKTKVDGRDVCAATAKVKDGVNDIKCDVGYYRVTNTTTGKIDCVACPTGYTKAADANATEAAANEARGAGSCTACATRNDPSSNGVDWYRVPADSYGCIPCPPSSSPEYGVSIKSCRGLGKPETEYLLCEADYYREVVKDNNNNIIDYKCTKCEDTHKDEDNGFNQNQWKTGDYQCNKSCDDGMFSPTGVISPQTCVYCPDSQDSGGTEYAVYTQCDQSGSNGTGVLKCKANHYYYYNSDKVSEKKQHECRECPANAGKLDDSTNVLGNNSGDAQCNACADGYFAPAHATANPSTCAHCPENATVCTTGDLRCPANHYYHYDSSQITTKTQYQCVACPALTGKSADSQNQADFNNPVSSDEAQCTICTDGWYGNMGNNAPDVRYCSGECQTFARLDELGICIRGTTDGPDDESQDGFVTNENSCYIKNMSERVEENSSSYPVQPTFSDTEGLFQFVSSGSVTYSGPSCDITSQSSEVPTFCNDLGANKYCVFINGDVQVNTALNTKACMKAIKWRTMVDGVHYGISDTTAKIVYSHWGKDNPWFCTSIETEATAFVDCLTGANSDCNVDNMACASAAQVSTCITGTTGKCP